MLRNKFLRQGQRLIETDPWYLAPLSWLYAALVWIRNLLYDWRLLPITKVGPCVVSVGNIEAGGTGKTPFVQMLTKSFPHRKIAILSRGYGAIPDEALLLAQNLPHIRVFVGKDSDYAAVEAAHGIIEVYRKKRDMVATTRSILGDLYLEIDL